MSVGPAATASDARSSGVNSNKERFGFGLALGNGESSSPSAMKDGKTKSLRKSKDKGKERASESGSFDASSQAQTPIQSYGESFASVVAGGARRPRKRSSTVQLGGTPTTPSLAHKPSLSEASVDGFGGGTSSLRSRKSTDRLLGDTQSAVSEGLATPKKPGKLKLSLSFAQVAASVPSSRSSASARADTTPRPSVSAASESSTASFESPRFAHPEDSDED